MGDKFTRYKRRVRGEARLTDEVARKWGPTGYALEVVRVTRHGEGGWRLNVLHQTISDVSALLSQQNESLIVCSSRAADTHMCRMLGR